MEPEEFPLVSSVAKGKRKEDLLRFPMRQLPKVFASRHKISPKSALQPSSRHKLHQVGTNIQVTLLFSVRVSVCKLEGVFLMAAGLTRRATAEICVL